MKAVITLKSTELNNEDLQRLARELSGDMRREVDVDSTLASNITETTGVKGDPITVGTIILTLLGGGGVITGLVKVWKAYIERGNHLEIEVRTESGASMSVKTDNLRPSQIEETTKRLTKLLEEAK